MSDLEDYEKEYATPEDVPEQLTGAVGPTDPRVRLLDAAALATAAMTIVGLAVAYSGNPSLGVPLMLIGGFVLAVSILTGIAIRRAPFTLRVFTRDAPPREPRP